MSTLKIVDADRNWRARIEAEAAFRAMREARRERNIQTARLAANVIAVGAMAIFLLLGLAEIHRSGLFSWLR